MKIKNYSTVNWTATAFAQDTAKEPVFKKRVLETTEVDFGKLLYARWLKIRCFGRTWFWKTFDVA
jgi:hypothetical protein